MATLQLRSTLPSSFLCCNCKGSLVSTPLKLLTCHLCERKFHLYCIPALVDQNNFYCRACLLEIFPFNHLRDDVEFKMVAMGLPYLLNFDYFSIQAETYTLNKTIYLMGQDSDVDEFFYDFLSNLVVQYLDTYQLGDKLSIKAISDLSLLHINARRITKNAGVANIELAQLKIKFSVIAITETWTTDDDKDVVFFPGYKTLLKSRPLETGYGGVGLFLNEDVISNFVIKSFPVEDVLMEILFIQTIVDGKTIIIGVIYKPPNMDLSSFNIAFGNLLTALALERKPCYLLGYFNVNLLKIGKHRETENFVNLLYASWLLPHNRQTNSHYSRNCNL